MFRLNFPRELVGSAAVGDLYIADPGPCIGKQVAPRQRRYGRNYSDDIAAVPAFIVWPAARAKYKGGVWVAQHTKAVFKESQTGRVVVWCD